MISNWNERVRPNDEVYHLGDFGFAPLDELQDIFDRLNGNKHLILGNHDKIAQKIKGWKWIKNYDTLHDQARKLRVGTGTIVLFHYAMRVWDKSHYGSIALYGHSHGSMPGNRQSLDVGVDCWDYRPINLMEIEARLDTLPKYTGYRQQSGGHDHHSIKEIDSDDF